MLQAAEIEPQLIERMKEAGGSHYFSATEILLKFILSLASLQRGFTGRQRRPVTEYLNSFI